MLLRIISSLLLINLASISYAGSECDQLAALEADPLSVSEPVKFADLNAEEVIAACSEAIITSQVKIEKARFTLQRARGYFRAGNAAAGINDLLVAYDLGYPAASFGLATAHFLGDGVEKNVSQAETLFLESYREGVIWSARGLALLYSEFGSYLYDTEKSILWENKFNEENN